jgi:chromosomal replication initiator protein
MTPLSQTRDCPDAAPAASPDLDGYFYLGPGPSDLGGGPELRLTPARAATSGSPAIGSGFSVPGVASAGAPRRPVGSPAGSPARTAAGSPAFVGDHRNALLAWVWQTVSLPELPSGLADHLWPLVLVGPSGVGKSLVARCLADVLLTRGPGEAVFTTGCDFGRSYQQAVDLNAVVDWRQVFVSAPVVVIDQLAGLADMVPAQQQLCEILDLRQGLGSPTILVSVLPPARCQFVDRLVSRLSQALVCPVVSPGPAALTVLTSMAFQRLGVSIAPPQIQILLLSGLRDVPTLQKIAHRWFLEQGSRDFQWNAASDTLKAMLGQPTATPPTCDAVVKATAKYFQLSVRDLRGTSRVSACCRARGVAIWICRQYLKMSYQQIGQVVGHRDHTTVLSSCRKIESLLPSDLYLQTAVQQLLFRLGLQ